MAVDADHGRGVCVGPVGLEDVIAFLDGEVALEDAFLVDARDGIFSAERRGEVFEDPLGGACEPVEPFLRLEVPVEEVAGVGLGPVAIAGDARRAAGVAVGEAGFGNALIGGDVRDVRVGIFGVAASVGVRAPLDVDEVRFYFGPPGCEGLFVLGVETAVPACPDAGRVDVGDVGGEVAAAEAGDARGVERVREVVHLLHEFADGGFVDGGVLVGPVVFIAEAPDEDAGVVVMLLDEIGEGGFGLGLPLRVADAFAAPGGFFPDEDAELVAEVEHEFGLLIVREADEVDAHFFHERELLAEEVFGLSSGEVRVVHVALRAVEEQAFAVELEGAVGKPFGVLETEALRVGEISSSVVVYVDV